jgi:hypothetical protein
MKRFARLHVLVALFVTLTTACAGKLEGEVDGEPAPAMMSGAFAVGDVDQGSDEQTYAAALFLSVPGACDIGARAVAAAKREGESPDDLVDALQDVVDDTLPDDFWAIWGSVLVDDTGDLDGDENDVDELNGQMRVCHFTEPIDVDDFTAGDADRFCTFVNDGELGFLLADDENSLAMTGDVELAFFDLELLDECDEEDEDEEGECDFDVDAGDVKVDLRADACAGLADGLDAIVDECIDGDGNTCSNSIGTLFALTDVVSD